MIIKWKAMWLLLCFSFLCFLLFGKFILGKLPWNWQNQSISQLCFCLSPNHCSALWNAYPWAGINIKKRINICIYIHWRRRDCKTANRHKIGDTYWKQYGASSCEHATQIPWYIPHCVLAYFPVMTSSPILLYYNTWLL